MDRNEAWQAFTSTIDSRWLNATPNVEDDPARIAVGQLDERDVAQAFVIAGMVGDLRILTFTAERLRGDMLDLEEYEGDLYVTRMSMIQGEAMSYEPVKVHRSHYDGQLKLKFCESGAEYMRVLAQVQAVSGADFISPSPWATMLLKLDSHYFGGSQFGTSAMHGRILELPTFHAGQMAIPELPLVLYEKQRATGGCKEWFGQLVCIADAESLALYPDNLKPIDLSFLVVDENDWEVDGAIDLRSLESLSVPDLGLYLKGKDIVTRKVSAQNLLTPHEMAVLNSFVKHPVSSPDQMEKGMKYCLVSLDFLMGFDCEVDEERLANCRVGLKNYAPVHCLQGLAFPDEVQDANVCRHKLSSFLVGCMSGSMLANEVFGGLAQGLVNNLVAIACSKRLTADQVISMFGTLGAPKQPVSLKIDIDDFDHDKLLDAQVTIPAGSDITFESFEDEPINPEVLGDLMELCELPVKINRLSSDMGAEAYFKAITDKKVVENENSYIALLLFHKVIPIEEVVAFCEAASDWDSVLDFYGPDALAPYIDQCPERVQTLMAVSTFDF